MLDCGPIEYCRSNFIIIVGTYALSEVTRILSGIESGDPTATEQLLPLVYDELRRLARARMAQERVDHTLQTTALVHEAYIRGNSNDRKLVRWCLPLPAS